MRNTPLSVAVTFPQQHEAVRWAEALARACAARSIHATVWPWHADPQHPDPQRPDLQHPDPWHPDPQHPDRLHADPTTHAPVATGGERSATERPHAPAVPSADYALGWHAPQRFFAAHPRLRAFFNAGAGVDAILSSGAVPASLPIYRLEDAGMGVQMAQYCALECLQRIGHRKAYAADQKQRRWQPRRPLAANDFPVGILGMGVLGTQVAATLRQLGFPVHGFRRSPGGPQQDCFAGPAQWDAFLAATRILIVLAPLTPATRGIIDASALARLMPEAWLINVARGPLVVERDLVAALDQGQLAGATLDVFATEPLPEDSPLWRHPKVQITPHVAACTLLESSVDQVAAKLAALLQGREPSGRVDPLRAY